MTPRITLLSAVVDTNLVVSGLILPRGVPFQLLEAFRQGAFILTITPELRAEYATVLARPKFAVRHGLTAPQRTGFMFLIDTKAQLVTPAPALPVSVRDPKDAAVLAAALGGACTHLVTGDDDLLSLSTEPAIAPLQIVTARQFLNALGTPNVP